MMKAAYLTKRPEEVGQVPELLQVGEIAAPPATDLKGDQVLVDVKAACVNVDDMHMQAGTFCGGIWFLQAPTPTEDRPRVVGCDFAGVVRAVGPKVKSDKIKVGDAVCGIIFQPLGQQGTWAQQVLTNQYYVVRIPPTTPPQYTYADWASLIMPAVVGTAMFKDGDVTSASTDDNDGEKKKLRCLVVGASGGIGSFLVQLLSAQPNVHVTGVCGPTNVEMVRGLGADEVFDYTRGSLTEQLERSKQGRFDRVFDLLGGSDLEEEAYASLLVGNGRFVTAVGPEKYIGASKTTAWEQIKYVNHIFLWAFLRNLIQRGKPTYHMSGQMSFDVDTFRLISEAGIKPVVNRLVPFEREQIVEAVKLVQSHRAKGRVVLAIDPECTQQVYPS